MSFKAIFKVDGNEYRVLHCNFDLNQEIDKTGRPSSMTRGGVVKLTVESTDDTSLFEWMCDSYNLKDASVVFNKRDEDSKSKELVIKDAYMVAYNENFDSDGSESMVETFSLSARVIGMGNAEHENEWPG